MLSNLSTYSFVKGLCVFMISRIIGATIIKVVLFLGLLEFFPDKFEYSGTIVELGIASLLLALVFSIVFPVIKKVTFLINILTLGGLKLITTAVSMVIVYFILNAIGFAAIGFVPWFLVLLLFTIV